MDISLIGKPASIIDRADKDTSIFHCAAENAISINIDTAARIGDKVYTFTAQTPVSLPDLIPGEDYGIRIDGEGKPFASLIGPTDPLGDGWIGGFHVAPGGCATARDGGDDRPAVNPHSFWDAGFRPACPDPRGMVLVDMHDGHRFWADIYLLGTEHKKFGTSRCGATIADGRSLERLNYKDAVTIYASHGKRLLTYDEFRAAAYGVTEKTSAARHPKTTGLDAERTSAFGLMQATGNLWAWGTDGDPDSPRPSIFGGSWLCGADAGSRYADLGSWGGNSIDYISARGAGDHLAPE